MIYYISISNSCYNFQFRKEESHIELSLLSPGYDTKPFDGGALGNMEYSFIVITPDVNTCQGPIYGSNRIISVK